MFPSHNINKIIDKSRIIPINELKPNYEPCINSLYIRKNSQKKCKKPIYSQQFSLFMVQIYNIYRNTTFPMNRLTQLSNLLQKQLTLPGIHLYFLRHGQSMANHAGSIVGWTDSKLSVKGRQQSNQLFRSFYQHIDSFTSIHSSDLSRCKDTLNLSLGFPTRPIKYTESLRQMNFGEMEGVHFDSLPAQDKKKINSIEYSAPNGQNWKQARSRALSYLQKLQTGHHLIATHGGLICSLTYELGLKYVVKNCGVVSVEMDSQTRELSKLNFVWEHDN